MIHGRLKTGADVAAVGGETDFPEDGRLAAVLGAAGREKRE